MQIFHKTKFDLKCHSRSQIMTFLIKNPLFLLFMLLIDWRNKCRWTWWKKKIDSYKNNICLGLTLTYVLMDNFCPYFNWRRRKGLLLCFVPQWAFVPASPRPLYKLCYVFILHDYFFSVVLCNKSIFSKKKFISIMIKIFECL